MVELFANRGDPDQTPRSAASDLGLHYLPITLLVVSRLQWIESHRKYFLVTEIQVRISHGKRVIGVRIITFLPYNFDIDNGFELIRLVDLPPFFTSNTTLDFMYAFLYIIHFWKWGFSRRKGFWSKLFPFREDPLLEAIKKTYLYNFDPP